MRSPITALTLGGLLSIPSSLAAPEVPWMGFGGSNFNNRWASSNTLINSSNIPDLQVACKIPFPGGISVTPTVIANMAYFPAWNGSLVALDYTTCRIKWQINVTALLPPSTPIQEFLIQAAPRSTPQVDILNKIIYFTSFRHCLVFAAHLETGAILAQTQISSHPLAQITQSPSLHLPTNTLYLGISSTEESINTFDPDLTGNATQPIYTFIGSALALRYSIPLKKFTLLWERKTLPEDDPSNPGRWSGAAVWGSQPALDVPRNQIYYATGNVYSVPDAYIPCTADPSLCTIPDRVWQNSVLAFDMTTGRLNWVRHLGPLDSWTLACTTPPINPDMCIGTPGPDADFGMAPAYIPKSHQSPLAPGPAPKSGHGLPKKVEDILVIGQKNGDVHAIYPSNGKVKWSTAAGPAAAGGGITWGISVDALSGRVYFNEANFDGIAWKPGPIPAPGTPDPRPTITGGAHSAIDLYTGEVLWQIPAKDASMGQSPPTTVGDVVIFGRQDYRTLKPDGSRDVTGGLVFLRKSTGGELKDLDVGTYHLAGVAAQGRYLVFGTGHRGIFDGAFWALKV